MGIIGCNIAEIVSSERTGRGWTQKTLAEKAHVTRKTIIRIEAGYSADITTIRAILSALDLDIMIIRRGEVIW